MMRIQGFNDQDMSAFLAKAEDNNSYTEFFELLNKSQALDPQNFMLSSVEHEGTKYAVVLSQHVFKRTLNRTFMSRQAIQSLAIDLLKDPFVFSRIKMHYVFWDGEKNKVVAGEDDGMNATAVVDEKHGIVFVYESGYNYIRVKTMAPTNCGAFRLNDSTVAIKVTVDGYVECNVENIPEVRPFIKHDNARFTKKEA